MRRALELAEKGKGFVSPNPMVGCVIVKNNKIVGEGFHQKAGTLHAERHALNEALDKAKDAELYVTLEPCSHYGRTPPCTEAIIKAGIKKVIAACEDPNPKVAGKGFKILNEAGIDVSCGLLEDEAKKLNEIFFKYISTGLPFVSLKTAMTCDGKIATEKKQSKWITNIESRQYSHMLRHYSDAILVGSSTVINDDPSLTTRLTPFKGKNPIRIILDGELHSPSNAKVYSDGLSPTILVTTKCHRKKELEKYNKNGIEILEIQDKNNKFDLRYLLNILSKKNITSILVEGGSETSGSFIDAQLIDRFYAFIAPKIAGGKKAVTAIGGLGIKSMDKACYMKNLERFYFNNDTLLTGNIIYKE